MNPTASTLPPSPSMQSLRREAEHHEGVPHDVDALSSGSGPMAVAEGRLDEVTLDMPLTPAERLAELDQRVRAFVVEHPAAAVIGAIGAGFVVGRLLSRR